MAILMFGNVYTDVLTIVQTGNGATTIRDGSAKLVEALSAPASEI